MARKVAPGVTVDSPESAPSEAHALEQVQAHRQKRDDARWYIIMGVAMLFAGSINAYLAAGGAAMCMWGLGSYAYWSRRMRSSYDPWKDRELDEWEDEHYG